MGSAAPLLAGLSFAFWQRLRDARRDRLALLAREREMAERERVAAERSQMAADLHDLAREKPAPCAALAAMQTAAGLSWKCACARLQPIR